MFCTTLPVLVLRPHAVVPARTGFPRTGSGRGSQRHRLSVAARALGRFHVLLTVLVDRLITVTDRRVVPTFRMYSTC